MTGWDPALAAMLFVGATGATLATAGVAPELVGAIYALANQGRFQIAKEVQVHLIRLFDAMLNAGEFPSGFRAGAQRRGFDIGRSRQPMCDSSIDCNSQVGRCVDETLAILTQIQYQHLPAKHDS